MTDTTAIWRDFGDGVRAYISRRVKSPDDTEDILQDVFLKVHARIETLDDESRLAPWVYRVAKNTVVDFYRRRAARPTVEDNDADLPVDPPEDDAPNLDLWMRGAVRELPDAYREAITITELEGKTQKEMAEQLGLSISGAKSRVRRGRAMIKEMLLACCHLEFDRRDHIIDYQRRDDCRYCTPGCDDDC